MNIECRHCDHGWYAPSIDSEPAVAAFKKCYPELRASAIRQLKEILGLGMMDTKQLATHVMTTEGKCFHCQAPLLVTVHFVKECQMCGAINLDIFNAQPAIARH